MPVFLRVLLAKVVEGGVDGGGANGCSCMLTLERGATLLVLCLYVVIVCDRKVGREGREAREGREGRKGRESRESREGRENLVFVFTVQGINNTNT